MYLVMCCEKHTASQLISLSWACFALMIFNEWSLSLSLTHEPFINLSLLCPAADGSEQETFMNAWHPVSIKPQQTSPRHKNCPVGLGEPSVLSAEDKVCRELWFFHPTAILLWAVKLKLDPGEHMLGCPCPGSPHPKIPGRQVAACCPREGNTSRSSWMLGT